MFVSNRSVACVSKVGGALARLEALQELADLFPGRLEGSLSRFAEQGFELGEDLLDRVEIGRVGRQENEPGPGAADGAAYGVASVAAEIVHDNDVARSERWHQDLLGVGEETHAIDRAVEHARRGDPIVTQRGEERHGLPMSMRHPGEEPCAAQTAPMGSRHVGLGPSLVDEDEALRLELALVAPPSRAAPGDVGALLLAGVQAFF